MAPNSRAEVSQQREKNPRSSLNCLSRFPQSPPQLIPPHELNGPAVTPPNSQTSALESRPTGALFSKGNLEIGAPAPLKAQVEDGKRLLFRFVEDFLQIELFGFQSGFGFQPDSLLFLGPHGSTLALPVDVLLEPREIALQLVQEKIRKSAEAFSR